jgi:tetratricopeptide (TPR) repeat protein
VATGAAKAHPADAYFALKTAQRLVSAQDKDFQRVMRWLNRALFLAPNGGEARLLAARVLARRGLWTQSADEYRAAMEVLPWELIPLIREVVARLPKPELVVRAIAQTPEHRRALGNRLLTERPLPFAREAIRLLEDSTPNDPELIGLRARACLALGELDCVRGAADALEAADRPLFATTLRARIALREARPDDARALVEGVRALGAHDRDFLRAAASIYRDLGDLKTAREYLDKLWPLVALEPRQAASVLALRAAAELRLGDAQVALLGYERAWRMHPAKAYAQGLRAAAKKAGRPESADAILKEHPHGGVDDPDADDTTPTGATTD